MPTHRLFLYGVWIARVLQIYSGGLGILAGDHCIRSAGDLKLPFVELDSCTSLAISTTYHWW